MQLKIRGIFVFLVISVFLPSVVWGGIKEEKIRRQIEGIESGEEEKGKQIVEQIKKRLEEVPFSVRQEVIEEILKELSKPPLRPLLLESKLEQNFNLPQFGYRIFAGPPVFTLITEIPVGPNYVLGPGDELIIDLWGMVEAHYEVKIDRDGGIVLSGKTGGDGEKEEKRIVLPGIGRIQLWGQTFENGQKLIKKQFLKHYKDFQISITLGKLRTIEVFVIGEAVQPGTYQLSSLSTIFTALYTAGGPSKMGSMRRIKLIRAHKTLTSFDLYSFLLSGDKSQDVRLQSGDVIFIPPVGSVVAVSGDVKRPAIYELGEDDISLKDLIQLAGGLFPLGQNFQLHLEKIEKGERKIIETKLTEPYLSERLKGGDFVQVFAETTSIYQEVQYVTLRGEVKRPGEYALRKGERLSSALMKAGGYTSEAYLPAAVFIRPAVKEAQQIILTQFLNNQRSAFLGSASQSGAKINLESVEKMISLITETMPIGRIAITLLPLDDFKGTPSDIVLYANDELYIPKKPSMVSVIGSVNSPGMIYYKPGQSVDYYIKKVSGGTTRWADKREIFIIQANGMAMQKSELTRFVDPGDTIIVPQTFRASLWTKFKDIVQVLYQVAVTAAALSAVN